MKTLLIGIMFAFLGACASIQTPQTNGERLAYAEATLAGLHRSAARLREGDSISHDQLESLLVEFDNVENLLRLARIATIQPGDDTAAARIAQISVALVNLQAKLSAAQQGRPDPLKNSPAIGSGATVMKGAGVQ